MKRILLFSITMLLFFANCSDDNSSTNNWYVFAETSCANPWGIGMGNPDADVIAAVESYLADLDVDVLETTIDSIGPGEACLACHCLTGRGIHVRSDVANETVLLEEGFTVE